MHFGVTFAVVLAACAAVGISFVPRTGHLVGDAQTTDTSAPMTTTNVSQAVPQATNTSVPASVPTDVNGSTLTLSPKPTTTSGAANTTSGVHVPATPNASAAPITSMPVNASKAANLPTSLAVPNATNVSSTTVAPATSMPVNASTATNIPTSMAVPNATNISSTTVAPKPITVPAAAVGSTEPNVSVVSNVPSIVNVSKPTNVSQNPSPVTASQATNVPPANCPESSSQQNTNPTEAMAELMKNLDMLTGLYTKVPTTFGFLSDAEEKAPVSGNSKREVQGPLEEFNMCTLSTRVGDERGPITVLVAAEDEERMRAQGSFYQLSNVFPENHRAFTSYCSGRKDVFLTFNPKRNR